MPFEQNIFYSASFIIAIDIGYMEVSIYQQSYSKAYLLQNLSLRPSFSGRLRIEIWCYRPKMSPNDSSKIIRFYVSTKPWGILNSVIQLSIKYPNVLTESGFPLSPTTTTHQLLLLYRNRRTASDGAVPNIVVTTPHFLQELKWLI